MWIALVCAMLLLLNGCSPDPEVVNLDAPWQHGENTRYEVATEDGKVVGTASWHMSRHDEGWLIERRGRDGHKAGEMVVDEDLRPIRGWREQGGLRAETVYKPEEVIVTKTVEGEESSQETWVREKGSLDNEQALQTYRSLPFAPGFEVTYTNVSAAGGTIPITIRVVGAETIEMPAGSFETWHTHLLFGSVRHEAWIGKHPPHYLVKYHNPTVGKVFRLRGHRAKANAREHGRQEPPAVAEPGSEPVSWSNAAIIGLIQIPLMSLLPILLGIVLSRKWKVSGKLWLAGAAAFVASQVVHLPLNWAIGLIGPPRGAGLLSLPAMALVAGLSAGVCEEVARYVALGVVLRKIRHSFQEAVQYGAGHGGIESMILGALVAIGLVLMIVIHYSSGALGLQGEALQQTLEGADKFWRTPWHFPLAAALERVLTICAHIGMSVLVMRAIACRNLAWLFAAIVAHTVLDGVALAASMRLGIWWTEVLLAGMAGVLLAITWRLGKADWPDRTIPDEPPEDPAKA